MAEFNNEDRTDAPCGDHRGRSIVRAGILARYERAVWRILEAIGTFGMVGGATISALPITAELSARFTAYGLSIFAAFSGVYAIGRWATSNTPADMATTKLQRSFSEKQKTLRHVSRCDGDDRRHEDGS